MKKITLILLLFFFQKNISAQKTVVSLPAMNMIYIGLKTEIQIGLEGYKNCEIITEISNAEIIKEEDKIFIKGKSRGEAILKIGVFKKNQKIWFDSTVFRVREIPKPEPQMGTMQDGAVESVGTIKANASRMFMAFGAGFLIEGVRANVTSFRFSVLDGFGIHSTNVNGSNINGACAKLLYKIKYGAVFIDQIYYNQMYNGDTISINLKSEYDVFIKAGTLDYNFSLKGNFLGIKEPIIFEKEKIDAELISLFQNNIKHGVWTDSSNPNEYYQEFYDSGVLIGYKVYDADGFKKVDITIPENSDSVFYKEIYRNGNIKREGWIIVNHDEIELKRTNQFNDISYFNSFRFVPTGKWMEYYENGKPKSESNFALLKDVFFRNNISDHFNVNRIEGMASYFNGTFKTYDENGNILQEFFYDKCSKNIIKK